jgi:rfaE bifunctional protein kinase chain/domain
MKKNTTVLVSGNFNVLHPGHLRLLRFAKEQGDRLIVAVQSDDVADHSAYVPEKLRLEGVRSISMVDESFIYSESVQSVIGRVKPDIVVKGKEYENAINLEIDELKKYGGRLIFSSGEVTFSSYDVIGKEFQDALKRTISFPSEFITRHKIDLGNLIKIVQDFAKIKICVFGDLIVDEYVTCEALGMSQEDPTIVVTPINTVRFIGGAGIVAGHAAGLGAKVDFISIIGNDEIGDYARGGMAKLNVSAELIVDESRPTTLKQRFRSKGKTLLRVSKLHQGDISIEMQEIILEKFKSMVKGLDLIIFSDFNYGSLPQNLVDNVIKLAKQNKIFIAADSQSSSQIGDIGRYKGVDLITPTEHEARISTRNKDGGLIVLSEELRRQTNSKNVFLKLGEEGFIIHAPTDDAGWVSDRIEALNGSPKDVAGAGDSLLTVSSMAFTCCGSVWESALLGAGAAAIQVGRVGNSPLNTDELQNELCRRGFTT